MADLLKLPLTNAPPGIPLGGAETFEEVFAKVDVNASDSLSWPEFASYFGQNHLALSSVNVGGGAKPGVMTRANMVRRRRANALESWLSSTSLKLSMPLVFTCRVYVHGRCRAERGLSFGKRELTV